MSNASRLDRLGPLVTAALAVAQVPVGRIANFAKVGVPIEERSRAARGPLTPPNPAFAIWGPIFAANIAYAARAARRGGDTPANRFAALAFLGNSLWSLEAQLRGFTYRSVAIIVSTGAAAAAGLLAARRSGDRLAENALGGLAGWLAVAAAGNVESTLIQVEGRPPSAAREQRAVLLATAASGVGVGLALASGGNRALAASACWGLGGVALRSRQEGRATLCLVALGGVAAVAAATLLARRR